MIDKTAPNWPSQLHRDPAELWRSIALVLLRRAYERGDYSLPWGQFVTDKEIRSYDAKYELFAERDCDLRTWFLDAELRGA